MKKILITSFLVLLFGLFLMFGYSAFLYYQALHSDDPIAPYVMVEKWATTVVRGDIAVDMTIWEKYDLEEKDIIITKKATLATVYWPDHSMTRLDELSRITIERLKVAKDYTTIELAATLESGKAWTRVVRTIYPGSFFEVRLPEGGIIAGVRGTTFDINLTNGYIQAVDHSIALADGAWRSQTLLPGELVSSKNIVEKLSTTVLDTTWSIWNQTKDDAQIALRFAQESDMIDRLKGTTDGISKVWDDFVRFILSFIPGFHDITLFEVLLWNTATTPSFSTQDIVSLYQRIQDKNFVQEREALRSVFQNTLSSVPEAQKYLESFARWALWDQMSFTGMTLPNGEKLLESYTKTLDGQIQNILEVIPLKDIEEKAKETWRQLLK